MTKITTILMDYDGTLHNHDAVITRSIDDILDQPGHQLYHTWRYRIHRDIIHKQHLDRHDDLRQAELVLSGALFETRIQEAEIRRLAGNG